MEYQRKSGVHDFLAASWHRRISYSSAQLRFHSCWFPALHPVYWIRFWKYMIRKNLKPGSGHRSRKVMKPEKSPRAVISCLRYGLPGVASMEAITFNTLMVPSMKALIYMTFMIHLICGYNYLNRFLHDFCNLFQENFLSEGFGNKSTHTMFKSRVDTYIKPFDRNNYKGRISNFAVSPDFLQKLFQWSKRYYIKFSGSTSTVIFTVLFPILCKSSRAS